MKFEKVQKMKQNKEDVPLVKTSKNPEYTWVPVNEPPFTNPVFPNPCKPSESEPDWTYVGK